MKTKILALLILCLPVLLCAQSYEQQGDELFAQAQYEKAVKKYNAAIELGVASLQVSQKVQNAQKCISLSTSATNAENNNSYSKASALYTQLYELNSIPLYQEKISFCQKKIKEAEQARIQHEVEVREKARKEEEKRRIEAANRERELHPEQWKNDRISKIKQLTVNKLFKCTQPYSNQLLYELYVDKDENNRWITTGRTLALMIEIDKDFTTSVTVLLRKGNDQDLVEILRKYKNLGTDVFAKIPFKYSYSITEEQIAEDVKSYMEILLRVRKYYSNQILKERQAKNQHNN